MFPNFSLFKSSLGSFSYGSLSEECQLGFKIHHSKGTLMLRVKNYLLKAIDHAIDDIPSLSRFSLIWPRIQAMVTKRVLGRSKTFIMEIHKCPLMNSKINLTFHRYLQLHSFIFSKLIHSLNCPPLTVLEQFIIQYVMEWWFMGVCVG